jgi:hypothetical protein
VKVIIAGDRTIIDYDLLEKAISKAGFDITEVVSGGAKGGDLLGEMWAKAHNIPVKVFKADWNNIKVKGVKIKERRNPFNGKMEKYNVDAGFARNKLMVEYADAAICLQPYGETSGTQHTIKLARKKGIPVYVQEREDKDYEYQF